MKKFPKNIKHKSLKSKTYQKMDILRISRQIPTNQCILHTKHSAESLVCNKDGTERSLVVNLSQTIIVPVEHYVSLYCTLYIAPVL